MSKKTDESAWHWIIARLRTHFLSGLLVVVPVAATILILAWVFNTVDNIFQPLIKEIIRLVTKDPSYNDNIVGLGFAITVVLVLVSGIVAGNFVGRKMINFGDSILKRIPLFRQIYTGAKQVVEGFSGGGGLSKAAFREVVLVEFPTGGMETIAFITNELTNDKGEKLYANYIPTSPVPSSGFSGIVTEDKIKRTKLTVDEALKMVISGMIIVPSSLKLIDRGKEITLLRSPAPKIETEDTPKE
jgi:uncharacterized membrane protein